MLPVEKSTYQIPCPLIVDEFSVTEEEINLPVSPNLLYPPSEFSAHPLQVSSLQDNSRQLSETLHSPPKTVAPQF